MSFQPRFAVFGLLLCGACGILFPGLSDSSTGAGGTGAAPVADAHAAQDAELAARLDQLGAQIEAQGVTTDKALEYAELAILAHENGAVSRGKVYGPTVVRGGISHTTAAREADPARAPELLVAEGRLELIRGRPERALETHVEALSLAPQSPNFWALVSLPNPPGHHEAIATACPTVRPNVPQAELADFVGACLTAAGGDPSALEWKTAKSDVTAYEAEMKRREEERLRREEEERLRREEEERLAREAAAKSQRYAAAAVFAAGRCEFGDCIGNGWTSRSDEGEIRTRCSFGKCLENGWETTFPDGSRATTRCSFSKCLENGWETTFPDGSRATTRCSFGKCASDGWETTLPDGSRSTTRCQFSKCFENGWETSLPSGGGVRCNCSFSDCLGNGAECG